LFQAINTDEFYQAFSPMMGKSIMFIVNKMSHDPDFMQSPFEILRVSNEPSVIKYFTERGLYKTPSKVMFGPGEDILDIILCVWWIDIVCVSFCIFLLGCEIKAHEHWKADDSLQINRTTHNTTDLLEEYIKGAYPNMRNDEAGPSNEPKRAKGIVASNILEWTFVSVFVFL
jgi:hypothetical protein